MSIVTKTGDLGKTSLFGGKRIPKSSVRLHAYGTVDELNACLGVALAETGLPMTLRDPISHIQKLLFLVGADLATPLQSQARPPRVEGRHTAEIDAWISGLEPLLPELKRFILPSGSRIGALLHQARTVCRRAERWIVTLGENEPTTPEVCIFLNRLGDFLFLAAREANRAADAPEHEVDPSTITPPPAPARS